MCIGSSFGNRVHIPAPGLNSEMNVHPVILPIFIIAAPSKAELDRMS